MALIDNIVDIKITRNTIGVVKREFSTILILGQFVGSAELPKYAEYTSMAAVDVDYDAEDLEYWAANSIFAQDITVEKIIIAQRYNNETYLDAYNRISKVISFYAVCVIRDVGGDLMPLALAVEASKSSGEAHILTLIEGDPINIGNDSDMKKTFDAKLNRTNVWYSKRPETLPPAPTQFLDAGVLGRMIPTAPGSNNWAGKTIVGITPDTPSDGELTNAKITKIQSLNGNFYTKLGNKSVTFNGKMASGEWIDTIYGLDWLEHTMQQDVADVWTTLPKIPYTNDGIAIIQTAMMKSLELAIERNVILTYKITTPDARKVAFSDKATRVLNGVKFEAILVGAINQIKITGYVTL